MNTFRLVAGVLLLFIGYVMLGCRYCPVDQTDVAFWAFAAGGVVVIHVLLDIVLERLNDQPLNDKQPICVSRFVIDSGRTIVSWLIAVSAVVIGIVVQAPDTDTVLAKLAIVSLGATVITGVAYTALLGWAVEEEEPNVFKMNQFIFQASSVILNLTFWGFIGGVTALVIVAVQS